TPFLPRGSTIMSSLFRKTDHAPGEYQLQLLYDIRTQGLPALRRLMEQPRAVREHWAPCSTWQAVYLAGHLQPESIRFEARPEADIDACAARALDGLRDNDLLEPGDVAACDYLDVDAFDVAVFRDSELVRLIRVRPDGPPLVADLTGLAWAEMTPGADDHDDAA